MLEVGIFVLYAVATCLAIIAAVFSFYSNDPKIDAVYCFFVDKQWRNVPHKVAYSYSGSLQKIFGTNLFGVAASVKAIFLAILVTFVIMISWRTVLLGSIFSSVEQVFGPVLGMATLSWALATAAVAPLSLKATAFFLKRSYNSESPFAVLAYTASDAVVSYILVGVSVYFCIVFTMPLIHLPEEGISKSWELIQIFASYAHNQALVWPTNRAVSVSGLSAALVSVATVLPTFIFIFLVSLALLSAAVLALIGPIVSNHLNWVSDQGAVMFSKHVSTLTVVGGAVAGIAKLLELASA